MAGQLTKYLRAGARQPFVWGECDCCLWVADWFKIKNGYDPVPHLRDKYKSAFGCAVILKRSGGLLKFMEDLMTSIGFAETAQLRPGDIALIEQKPNPVLAIWVGKRFAAKSMSGLVMMNSATIIKAWHI